MAWLNGWGCVVVGKVQEIAETEASGTVAAIYHELKATQGVPMVALIYRHLATMPGTLEWAWRILGPLMKSGELPDAARRLAEQPLPMSMSAPTDVEAAAIGLRPLDRAAIAYIIAAYETTNHCNLVAVGILRRCLDNAEPSGNADAQTETLGEIGSAVGLPPLPAPLAVDAIPRSLLDRLDLLRPPDTRIVPTLYRHLAPWPAYLSDMAERLRPLVESGQVGRATAELTERGQAVSARFAAVARPTDTVAGRPSGDSRTQLATTLDDFAATIPEMIVVGRLLRAALPAL